MTDDAIDPSMLSICDDLGQCAPSASSVVIVIDVIRAFTTAAVLIARGAAEIICVHDAAEASALAANMRDALIVVGEQDHPPFPEVDLPNSPVAAASADVDGRSVAFFTVNGTRVLAQVPPVTAVLGCAVVNISATAAWVLAHHHGAPVHVVVSDPDSPEDLVCADQLAALLTGTAASSPATRAAVMRAGVLRAAEVHARRWRANVPEELWRSFLADVRVCAQADAFPVVLAGTLNESGLLIVRPGSAP